LESAGYEVQAVVIPAAAVNAPHGRDRVWFVAHDTGQLNGRTRRQEGLTDSGRETSKHEQQGRKVWGGHSSISQSGITADTEATQNTMRSGCTHGEPEQERTGIRQQRNISSGSADGLCLSKGLTADTDSNGQHRRNREHEVFASEGRLDALGDIGTGGEHGLTADTGCTGWEKHNPSGESDKPRYTSRVCIEERGNWENFPTEPPICGGDDGIPTELDGITFSKWRNESIKAYGNAVVPQVVYQIFKAIEEIDYLCKR
jgi:DNA (cytosine-5)-methyltransferase 1